MLGTNPGEKDIMARLREIEGITFMEGTYTETGFEPTVDENTLFAPYALVSFGGFYPGFENGIVGSHLDTHRATFSIYVVAPFDSIAREFRDEIRNKMMVNFRPTDGSALRPNTGYSFTDGDLGFNRYVQVVGFSYKFNLSNDE